MGYDKYWSDRAGGSPTLLAPGASGKVDVTLTHRNAPQGSTMTARAEGDVNVHPPRVETQELAAA